MEYNLSEFCFFTFLEELRYRSIHHGSKVFKIDLPKIDSPSEIYQLELILRPRQLPVRVKIRIRLQDWLRFYASLRILCDDSR